MEPSYTIVVPDTELLSRLCGTNDSNLRLIEHYLGVPVLSRGNEISIAVDNPKIAQEFKYIIDRITDELAEGIDPDADMLASIFNVRAPEGGASEADEAESVCISVPGGSRKIYPKTENQAALVRAMRKSDLVFCVGPAGTGKTFLAAAEAIRLLLTRRVSSLILTRPVVEAGESLGFLPGDLEQKLSPYLRPLYDAMELILTKERIRRLMESGSIEIAPLAYMRGRTLSRSAIILDEAQNTSREQMKLFLTRMGLGSKMFVTGDITQIDLPKRTPSGLIQALELLRPIPEISILEMDSTDVVRHPLAKKIIQAYEHV